MRALITAIVVVASATAGAGTRPPAVAGSFYTDDAVKLRAEVEQMLEVPAARVQVLAVRPSRNWGELHGLYTLAGDEPAKIQVWMRTARHRRIVAFRTFLRTLLHELGHHLDYTHLRLPDSFHTEGFFKRESSLFRQVVPTGGKGS